MNFRFVFIMVIAFLVCGSFHGALMAEPEPANNKIDSTSPSTRDIGGLSWLSDKPGFQEATEILKDNERPFLIYFVRDSCVEICSEFEELVLSDPEVVKHIEKFTRVIVNTDQAVYFGERFGISEFPSLLVMRASGSAQRVRLPKTKKGVLLYKPNYVFERMKLSGLR